ncbi:hypothetical protein [Candidatus Frankia alpina]|uniref:hypothetical protein n=1 Tax=Candidatus Frankia alpina TaxID=2699483 RepID=UPI001F41753D|nr:hypothetical protein [Candidatus Frankia alpina]
MRASGSVAAPQLADHRATAAPGSQWPCGRRQDAPAGSGRAQRVPERRREREPAEAHLGPPNGQVPAGGPELAAWLRASVGGVSTVWRLRTIITTAKTNRAATSAAQA